MSRMDMEPLQARFETQDQAESVIRKLSALRSDRFRLERTSAGAAASSGGQSWNAEIGSDLGAIATPSNAYATSAAAEFTLSAIVPAAAADQARTVIRQAGGVIY